MADLRKELEKILEKMGNQERNLLPFDLTPAAKEDLVEAVANKIEASGFTLTDYDLKNEPLYKAFQVALLSQILGQKYPDEFNFDYTVLFKNKLTADELKQELKLQITNMLQATNKLYPDRPQLSPKEINAIAEKVTTDLMEKYDPENAMCLQFPKDNPSKEENASNNVINIFQELIATTLRYLYDGEDPRFPEKMELPQLGPRISNALGYTHQGEVVTTDKSVMGEEVVYDEGVPDYVGKEAYALMNEVAMGIRLANQMPSPHP